MGLHAHVAWKQAGHSSQPIAHLLDVAQRLSDIRWVCAMLLMQDVLRGIVPPFSKQVQGHLEPTVFGAVQATALAKIEMALQHIRHIRRLMRAISLCRQHAGPADLANLLTAFACGSRAATFPAFFEHVPEILGPQHSFRGCKMEVPDDFDASADMLLGAHCQCAARERHWADIWARARTGNAGALAPPPPARPPQQAGGRDPPPPPMRAGALARPPLPSTLVRVPHPRRRGREITVPVWVAGAEKTLPYAGDYVNVGPRLAVRKVGSRLPPGRISSGMFRRNLRRCQVSRLSLIHI